MLFPYAIALALPYLVTVYWYRKSRSLPFMLLASLVHPIVTAAMFACFVAVAGQAKFGTESPEFSETFVPTFTVFGLYAILLAFPFSALVALSAAPSPGPEDSRENQLRDPPVLRMTFVAVASSILFAFTGAAILAATSE